MSAPFRYARILNGLSSLISRRSAISLRIRAIATLSNPQPFGLDAVVENARATGGERVGHRSARLGRAVTEQAAATAGAAHLGSGRSSSASARDQIVDDGRRHAGREPFAVVPLGRDLPADLVPVAALEGDAHRGGRVADPLETVEDVAIAVGVALGDVPVVGAGVSRRAGVGEDDPLLELRRIDRQTHPLDAVDAQLD